MTLNFLLLMVKNVLMVYLYKPNRNYTRFTFSSILNTLFGERTNKRLKALPRQRRSSVLRRTRLTSAMRFSENKLVSLIY